MRSRKIIHKLLIFDVIFYSSLVLAALLSFNKIIELPENSIEAAVVIGFIIAFAEAFFYFREAKKENMELLKNFQKIVGIDSKLSIVNGSIYFWHEGVGYQCKYMPEEDCIRYILKANLPEKLNFSLTALPNYSTAFPRFSMQNYYGEIVKPLRQFPMTFITLDRKCAEKFLQDNELLNLLEEICSECEAKREVMAFNDSSIELYVNNLATISRERLSKISELAKKISSHSNLKGNKCRPELTFAEIALIAVSLGLLMFLLYKLLEF